MIVPPVPVILAFIPLGMAPKMLLKESESSVLVLEGDKFAVTTATTPLPIGAAFIPVATQVRVPDPEPQVRVSPMDVSADPAAMLTEEMAVAG